MTVPSCNAHNQAKTNDDEYLRTIITMCLSANSIATKQFRSTVLRGAQEQPGLLRSILSSPKQLIIQEDVSSEPFDTVAVEIDRPRIDSSLRQIALGIYHNKYEKPFIGCVDVFPFFLADLTSEYSAYNEAMLNIRHTCDHVILSYPPKFGH